MHNATNPAGRNILPRRIILPADEREMAKEFSAVILPYDRGTVALAAKRSKDAVKLWKAADNGPSLLAALNMAQQIPAVRNWMLGMLGITDGRDAVPPDAANALLGGLQFVAQIPGPEGAQARAMLAKMELP